MSTPPINNLETTPLIGSKTTEDGIFSAATTNDTKVSTAKILAFPQKPLNVSVQSMEYLPSNTEATRNLLIEQILIPENYSSKSEKISKQVLDRELRQNLIEKSLGEAMRMAAKNDVKNGVFGDVYVKNNDNKLITGYVSEFRRGLTTGLAKALQLSTTKSDDDNERRNLACDTVSQIFGEMQSLLLTSYGTLVTKERHHYATNEDLDVAIGVLKIKENYWKGKLSQVIEKKEAQQRLKSNQTTKKKAVPEEYEMSLSLLLDAFVKNYVHTVWETESAMRQVPETEIAKSA